MKKKLFSLGFCFLFFYSTFGQIEYLNVQSSILNEYREVKVQLPRNYERSGDKIYPVILVFDGDYLFEPVAGVVDYLSYWEEIPEALVVGINQSGHRMDDAKYDSADFLPISTGAKFYDFVDLEVMQYLKENYNVGNLKIAVGHDLMANFINFFIFSKQSKFQGYINLSPDIPEGFIPFIKKGLETSEERVWYSLTTGSDDLKFLQEKTKKLYDTFSEIDNEFVSVSYKSFENSNHYTFVVNALPYALQQIFELYTPINKTEYNTKLSDSKDPVDYLLKKYDDIKKLYSVDIKVRISDIMQISKFISEKELWDSYRDLAKIAKRNYPDTLLTDYFLAKYFQETGQPKKAIKAYQAGYAYEEIGGITKELMLDEAARLKETFGY